MALALEKEVNRYIVNRVRRKKILVLSELRMHPSELDIVCFDPTTLYLTNIEIKRNNWRKLYEQALRGKLYCHFSIAVMPLSYKKKIPLDDFILNGIGIIFYQEIKTGFRLFFEVQPQKSAEVNRHLKKQIYTHLFHEYGNLIHA